MLSLQNAGKRFGPRLLFQDANWLITATEKTALVGANGTGKSTLMKVLAGLETLDYGLMQMTRGMSIGYLPQEGLRLSGRQVFDECLSVFDELRAMETEVESLAGQMASLDHQSQEYAATAERYSLLQARFHALDGYALDSQVGAVLGGLGFTKEDWSRRTEEFSGGWQMRIALAKLLLARPNLLLLDEPTNHLDAETVNWLEGHLRSYPGAILIVTHDRYFLDNVTSWILELDRGKGIPYEGNYSAWLRQKQKRMLQENREDAARQRAINEESEWIAASPKARQSKSKARIAKYEELVQKQNDKAPTTAQIVIPVSERLGQNVIDFENISKGYGETLLIDKLSFRLPPGGIVGVIGPNGAGKTTLFRMITGQEKPDSGSIKIGESVQLGYVDQSRDSLDAKKTVWEEISGGYDLLALGKREVNSRAYCGSFNFKGPDQQKKVGMLSGGERNRVHLAKMLKTGANVLLLDEPTNDLDVETLRALEEALLDFAGCAVIISHDRFFLDRIATHMLAYEGDGHVEWFEGNFGDYEEDKKRRLGVDSLIPHRMKYKKFSR